MGQYIPIEILRNPRIEDHKHTAPIEGAVAMECQQLYVHEAAGPAARGTKAQAGAASAAAAASRRAGRTMMVV